MASNPEYTGYAHFAKRDRGGNRLDDVHDVFKAFLPG